MSDDDYLVEVVLDGADDLRNHSCSVGRGLYLAPSASRPRRKIKRSYRSLFHFPKPGYRIAMGRTDVGYLVGVGRTGYLNASAIFSLSRLYRTQQRL